MDILFLVGLANFNQSGMNGILHSCEVFYFVSAKLGLYLTFHNVLLWLNTVAYGILTAFSKSYAISVLPTLLD